MRVAADNYFYSLLQWLPRSIDCSVSCEMVDLWFNSERAAAYLLSSFLPSNGSRLPFLLNLCNGTIAIHLNPGAWNFAIVGFPKSRKEPIKAQAA